MEKIEVKDLLVGTNDDKIENLMFKIENLMFYFKLKSTVYFSFVLFLVLDLADIRHRHIMVQFLAKCLILDQQFDQMFHWNIEKKEAQICKNECYTSTYLSPDADEYEINNKISLVGQ